MPAWGDRVQPRSYFSTAEVKKGRAVFKGLGPGKYVFYNEVRAFKPLDADVLGIVEVQPDKVVHVGKAKE